MKRKQKMYIICSYLLVCLSTINLFAQTKQTSSTQSSAGGEASSLNYRVVATAGQSISSGPAISGSYGVSTGFISTIQAGESSIVDNTPPTITHNQVTRSPININIIIRATVTDDLSQLKWVKLEYKKTGAANLLATVDFSGDQAVIPAADNTTRGLQYAITAEDTADNSIREPITGFYSIQAEINEDQSSSGIVQHSGGTASAYRIFSVPFDLDDKRPAVVFEDDLGGFDDTKWKLFGIQNGNIRSYDAIGNLNVVQPGAGFLLITNQPNIVIDAGSGLSTKVPDHTQIALTQGWNLIGNPFLVDVPLSNLTPSNGTVEYWYHGNSGWTTDITHLRAWEGLAINSIENATLTIGPGISGNINIVTPKDLIANEWGIQLKAYGSESKDLCNYIGLYPESGENVKSTWSEPPRMTNAISISLKPDSKILQKSAIQSKLSSILKEANIEGNFWDFKVEGDKQGEKVRLEFEYFGEIQPGFDGYLVDTDLKMAYDLKTIDSGFEIKIGESKQRNFRVLIGTEEFLESNSLGIDVIPTGIELRQNFPNPFNPSTTVVFTLDKASQVNLEIYNVLGQKVRTLIDNEQMQKGYHPRLWDGRNDRGDMVATGIYFIRLNAGNQVKMRKAIFAK